MSITTNPPHPQPFGFVCLLKFKIRGSEPPPRKNFLDPRLQWVFVSGSRVSNKGPHGPP